ncbi:hypothetical protein GF362_00160 [Candidatus Dojkabacteria bacterium]|nr:hypothetical protein [Candidatus Dojkabacteria bacterium]
MNIFDIIVDALEFNEGVDFINILACVGLYWLFFWFSISVWVFLDARKRYENPRIALLWAFVVFFLFFPALIFYLAVRKSEDPLELDLYEEAGGVNVPLVNFTGNEGMQMTLELNIQKMPVSAQPNDMEVDVRWKSKQDKMKLIEKVKEQKEEKKRPEKKVSNFILRVKRKIKSLIDNFKKKREEKKKQKRSEKKIKIEIAKKKKKDEKDSRKEKEIGKESMEKENKDKSNKEKKENLNKKEEEMKKRKNEEKVEKSEKDEHQNKKEEEEREHKENKNDN